MADKQNIFYTSISTHYSDIFPYNPKQLFFVANKLGSLPGKQILDIGCATGQLTFQLAAEGAEVTGIDLNEDLLAQAKENIPQPNLKFQSGDMLELENDFRVGQFDSILCFGNTMVHLQALTQMRKMIFSVYNLLKEGGHFLLQILNYDHILAENITELPLIETDAIKFVRKYEFLPESRLINFKTDLLIKHENKLISNTTTLFALKSKELVHLLITEGFKSVELYSNFNSDPFGGNHLPLVVSCRK
ncbi:class I SAM-dependent methyltransferase [Maribellus sediminis]|uniref:class I SAM-dependent methyltransferase n=1 Tax=Maribellus sediminis TaxID=2696285 RepID=UPI00143182EA|nr:class I SAM-dependent methyltransferase [Maribellus sediminis]